MALLRELHTALKFFERLFQREVPLFESVDDRVKFVEKRLHAVLDVRGAGFGRQIPLASATSFR